MTKVVRNHVKAKAGILDGEMIVVDTATSCNIPFGLNKPVALAENNDSTLQLCYKIFDLLYVKGNKGEEVNLIKTLKVKDRKKILKRIIQEEKNVIEVVEGNNCKNIDDIEKFFN